MVDVDTLTLRRPQAVSYLRVSTREQAERGSDPEGYSIPAQRDANLRMAESIGAEVVAEFVDRGESAKSADRPELKRMLEFVKHEKVTFCIVHKVDRLARNRVDDVQINVALKAAGVSLVSATENIDETPSGMLVHGIMSSIAEFYSRNLATEVKKGLNQKVKTGGTVTRAPIGYRNIRTVDELGREARTVEIDTARAPLIQWAFKRYADGDVTLRYLALELEARGLTSVPTPQRASKPITTNQMHKILTNPYYKGEVVYNGATYEGRHKPLVSAILWQKVREVLSAHVVGEKVREHHHYLKGQLYCGKCGSKMAVQHTRNRHGVLYRYFMCSGRHDRRTDCDQKSVQTWEVEDGVVDLYRSIHLGSQLRQQVEKELTDLLLTVNDDVLLLRDTLKKQTSSLKDKQRKLLEAHLADAIPLDVLKEEQDIVAAQLASATSRLEATDVQYGSIKENLAIALDLIENCRDAYESAPDHVRRWFNLAFFEKIIVTDEDITVKLASPMRELLAIPALTISAGFNPTGEEIARITKPCPAIFAGQGLEIRGLVDPRGFEPLTPCMPCRCATGLRHGPRLPSGEPDNL
jgi:site-specific DNA recombinase